MEKVILISGKALNGKDAFASLVKENLEQRGKKVAVTHFAKYIKNTLIDFYDAKTIGGNYNTIVKDDFVRTKLQELGTEVIREEMKYPLFHVQRACEDIDIIKNDFDYIIIPDCRFWNEVDFTKAYFPRNVIDVRVKRLNFVSTLSEKQQNHPSETDLDDYPFSWILEAEDLQKLKEEVDYFVKFI